MQLLVLILHQLLKEIVITGRLNGLQQLLNDVPSRVYFVVIKSLFNQSPTHLKSCRANGRLNLFKGGFQIFRLQAQIVHVSTQHAVDLNQPIIQINCQYTIRIHGYQIAEFIVNETVFIFMVALSLKHC